MVCPGMGTRFAHLEEIDSDQISHVLSFSRGPMSLARAGDTIKNQKQHFLLPIHEVPPDSFTLSSEPLSHMAFCNTRIRIISDKSDNERLCSVRSKVCLCCAGFECKNCLIVSTLLSEDAATIFDTTFLNGYSASDSLSVSLRFFVPMTDGGVDEVWR
ncbi:hypothetical protein OCU04_002508 [Sclerotinia nivalis]|uniref:Uncharacterized protein n=1 Tax=Sclerotinia nivalis TaxID=352851 RepID=A0A9X0ATR4_9HELO|nr:hypothetical protein OCU04_002508 [Sclerotinia nivalis]